MHRFRHRDGLSISRSHHAGRHIAWGGAWIAAGVIFLLERQGVLTHHELWLIAPVALAWSALVRTAFDRTAYGVAAGVARLVVAAYLYIVIEQVGGWTWATTWPVLLIAAGIATIARALLGRGHRCGMAPTQEPSA